MGKHTAGKWSVSSSILVCSEDGKVIANCLSMVEIAELSIGIEEASSNAALISAAPDLLQALEAGYIFALNHPHDAYRARNQETLCAMRDAICKATGRDSQDVQEDYEERALIARGK